MLSPALAAAAGETPAGSFTSMASANGTRTTSASTPPQPPPAAPIPYIDVRGTAVQLAVRPRRQKPHAPHAGWNGTATRSPDRTLRTASPISRTSATDSWPSGNGRSEEHTSELQSLTNLVCRLLLE